MRTFDAKLGAAMLILPLATGCVNDDYDLSDIDTTTQIKVEDLVVPVNLDVVTLGDIITFDEGSKIQPVTINGKTFYALTEKGEFHSEPIEITKVTAPAPNLKPTEAYLNIVDDVNVPSALPTDLTVTYKITKMGNDFHYDAGVIDEAIVALDYVKADIDLYIVMEALETNANITKVEFTDVTIEMPKGLEATTSTGTYNPKTGLWSIPSLTASEPKVRVAIHATGVDFETSGAVIGANHTFTYDGPFHLTGGTVALTTDLTSTLPTELHFRASYGVSDLNATAFSGIVNYKLDGLNINPISLSDIPDFLSGEGTKITLNNPQIYLGVNNPVAGNALDCSTGLTLSATFDGISREFDYSPDHNEIVIGHDRGANADYEFVLAPTQQDLAIPAGYSAPQFVQFSSLGGLLTTPADYPAAGLPTQIGIRLDNPQIAPQHVTDFELGRSLPAVNGHYDLVAPLSLGDDALIVYSDREDGWNDADVDAITITKLRLTADVTNQCPLDVELYAWPIDVNGNKIQGVEVKSSYLAAGAEDTPIVIEMTGTVKHLDGVIYEARVMGSNETDALSPDQTITLKKIRVNVSGYYEKEL